MPQKPPTPPKEDVQQEKTDELRVAQGIALSYCLSEDGQQQQQQQQEHLESSSSTDTTDSIRKSLEKEESKRVDDDSKKKSKKNKERKKKKQDDHDDILNSPKRKSSKKKTKKKDKPASTAAAAAAAAAGTTTMPDSSTSTTRTSSMAYTSSSIDDYDAATVPSAATATSLGNIGAMHSDALSTKLAKEEESHGGDSSETTDLNFSVTSIVEQRVSLLSPPTRKRRTVDKEEDEDNTATTATSSTNNSASLRTSGGRSSIATQASTVSVTSNTTNRSDTTTTTVPGAVRVEGINSRRTNNSASLRTSGRSSIATQSSTVSVTSNTTNRSDTTTSTVPGAVRVEGINSRRRQEEGEDEEEYQSDGSPTTNTREGSGRNKNDGSANDGGSTTEPETSFSSGSDRFLAPNNASILAVAEAIEENDEEELGAMPLARGIKIDPNAKPPIFYKTYRFRLYAFLVFVVIIATAIGVAVGITYCKKKDEDLQTHQTVAPTCYRETVGIRSVVERAVGEEVLRDPKSPYLKALEWVTCNDPLELTPNSTNIIQRFIIVYLHYATTVDGLWRSCNPPNDPWNGDTRCTWSKLVDTSEDNRFMDVYPSTAWLSNSSECAWAGITCDRLGQVKHVDMAGFGLSGTFPEGIFNLPFLQVIVMSLGRLKGPLPSQLGTMYSLINFSVVQNQFSGSLPRELWTASNLRNINIGHNKITGTLSTEIANLQDLHYLRFEHNRFLGTLPSEIGMLSNLLRFDVSSNQLLGEIPSTIRYMNRLQVLRLQSNKLSGNIPRSIGKLSNLNELALHNNRFTGKLPDYLFEYTEDMMFFDVSNCELTGTLSPLIAYQWTDLMTFRISNNKFHGTIPVELGELPDLVNVLLDGNEINGTVPEGICSEVADGAGDKVFTADCAPNNDGYIELSCSCCTICCEPSGKDCLQTDLYE